MADAPSCLTISSIENCLPAAIAASTEFNTLSAAAGMALGQFGSVEHKTLLQATVPAGQG